MLSLFAPTPAALPAPLATYSPALALPDWPARVEKLRRWQQSIASGYVTSQKEEALQAEFLNLVFGEALGYEHQRPEYRQLLLEKKTNVDGTKPDGALGDFGADGKGALGGPVRAVVELKDARTSLDAKQKLGAKGRAETPVEQAFSYPSKMGPSCRWVIVSNFVTLRLYAANDQTRAEVFDFRTLPDDPAALGRFFALLGSAQLLPAPGQPDALLDLALRQRQEQEARISKDFYRDYRAARRALLDHLIEQNPAVLPIELLRHTQKLLDRIIFVCFCEDRQIMPERTLKRLLQAVEANVFDRMDDSIYRSVRGLFRSIDKGNEAAKINRFNGGLFAEDAALDGLTIKDAALKPIVELGGYNFASELNVNILGHIFEQSLADLEAERARLLGQAPPPAKQGKRKQDGIFYTPDYITRYIVGQAVGGWLRERRQEAGLDALPALTESDLGSIRVRQGGKGLLKPEPRVQKHIDAWEAYGQRLRTIRVLDPACGSGAFLNEAFGYLLREGQVVNDALAKLRANQRDAFLDLDRHILQHNLYGVDLNPESVQITRLSLWLQTANPGRPLTSLDHSIRCGNSLIADPAVAGDRAFDWPAAFPEAFAAGGFDVVVGNPPYVRVQNIPYDQIDYYKSIYKGVALKRVDISLMFFELSNKLLRANGTLSFITSNQFTSTEYGEAARKFIITSYKIKEIIDFGDLPIFADALTYVSIFTLEKNTEKSNFPYLRIKSISEAQELSNDKLEPLEITIESLGSRPWVLAADSETKLFEKLEKFPTLGGIGNAWAGLFTGLDEVMMLDAGQIKNLGLETGIMLPLLRANDPKRFAEAQPSMYVIYPYKTEGEKTVALTEDELLAKYPNTYQYLLLNKNRLGLRKDSRKTFGDRKDWFALTRFGQKRIFEKQKIVSPGEVKQHKFSLDNTGAGFSCARVFAVTVENPDYDIKFILALLNSKVVQFFLQSFSSPKQGGYYTYSSGVLNKTPIPNITPAKQQPFIDLAEQLLAGHRALHAADADLAALLRAELGLATPLSGKLALTQPWKPWSTALEKSIARPLALKEKAEWLRHLEAHQQAQAAARQHLAQLDKELDKLVYDLYQLTPAEVALVAGGTAA